MIKTPPTVMPDFIRINDGDLSEIELHSVDSINDLHVEHFSKGGNPLHQGQSTNGNLQERPVVYHAGHAAKSCGRKWIFRFFSATDSRYSCGCMVIALLLVTIGMIFFFLGLYGAAAAGGLAFKVQQGSVLQALFQGMRERQEITLKISRLIEELHSNLTSSSG